MYVHAPQYHPVFLFKSLTSGRCIAKDVTLAQVEVLWPALVSATSGKSWSGKERVLEAFVTFAVGAKHCLHSDAQKMGEIELVCLVEASKALAIANPPNTQIVQREAKRNNATYRGPAIRCLGIFADGFETLDLFEKTFDIVAPALSPVDQDEMDVDREDGESAHQLSVFIPNGLALLTKVFSPHIQAAQHAGQRLEDVISSI